MAGVATITDTFTDEPVVRREYTVKITSALRIALDQLAQQYNLYTLEGTARDAEIVRVLLVCALTEGWVPRKQAGVALYVNGLMLVSQGLWLGFSDIRDDLTEAVRLTVGEVTSRNSSNAVRSATSKRFHVKVDEWMRDRIAVVARATGYVQNGTVQDTALVAALIQHAVDHPESYQYAFAAYARGIAHVRKGLTEGLVTIRDSLRAAVAVTTRLGVTTT